MFGADINNAEQMFTFTHETVNYDYFNEDSLTGAISSISALSLATIAALAVLFSW